jgi:hypothetical protein
MSSDVVKPTWNMEVAGLGTGERKDLMLIHPGSGGGGVNRKSKDTSEDECGLRFSGITPLVQ